MRTEMAGKKKYDIIFTDLLMPGMDGFQVLSEIRKAGSEVPVIALTADEKPATRQAAIKAGFNDFLVKPASEDGLRKVISMSISKSS